MTENRKMFDFAFVDIDHTLSDARWRDERIAKYASHADVPESVWESYHLDSDMDAPVWAAINLSNALFSQGVHIVILTARPEYVRKASQSWLRLHQVKFDRLVMRPTGDRTPSAPLKLAQANAMLADWSEEIIVRSKIIIDDRSDIVELFSQSGYSTFQFRLPAETLKQENDRAEENNEAKA